MGATRTTSGIVPRDILAIMNAARVAEVEFSDWWVGPATDESTISGHVQVVDRNAVSRILEALLRLDAPIDVDVGPSTADSDGRWSVWIRACKRERRHARIK